MLKYVVGGKCFYSHCIEIMKGFRYRRSRKSGSRLHKCGIKTVWRGTAQKKFKPRVEITIYTIRSLQGYELTTRIYSFSLNSPRNAFGTDLCFGKRTSYVFRRNVVVMAFFMISKNIVGLDPGLCALRAWGLPPVKTIKVRSALNDLYRRCI